MSEIPQNSQKPSDVDAAAEQMLQTVAELADRDAQLEEMQQQLTRVQGAWSGLPRRAQMAIIGVAAVTVLVRSVQ